MLATWRSALAVILGYGLAAISLALLVLLVVVPRVMGGAALTVLTGSMGPTIPAGSVVLVQPKDPGQILVGDVITFEPAPDAMYVTHRIIEAGYDASGQRVFYTQGDANPIPDQNPVAEAGVAGVVRLHLPYLGYATQYVDVQTASFVAAALAGEGGRSISGRRRLPAASGPAGSRRSRSAAG
jgi:signal peptidase I